VRWEPDDIDEVAYYRIQYAATDPRTGKPLVVRQEIERASPQAWTITDKVSREDSAYPRWEQTGQATWPHPYPPIVECQNLPAPNEWWGRADIEPDILQTNYSINFVLSNIARILRFHAHPKTWGSGFTAQQLNVAVDETIVLPAADARLANLEMQSDLASSIEFYKRLKEALHEISRVPEVATGKLDSAGSLSGVALQILYQPLLEKTEVKRRLYGDMLVELNRRLLDLGGHGDDNETQIQWPELLPSDPKAEAETYLIQQQIGVSTQTLLSKMGYDPDKEREQKEANAEEFGAKLLTSFERGQEAETPEEAGARAER
jgi:hypothetical protein